MRGLRLPEVLAVTWVASLCSLVYEMTIAACFVAMTGDEVTWLSLTIAIYLAALGIGTALAGRLRAADPWPALFRVELALTAAGALCVAGIHLLENAYRFYFRFYRDISEPATLGPFVLTLILCHGFTVLIGILSGFEVPLLLRAAAHGSPSDGKGDHTHVVLGLNYLGALGGALAFGLVLLPRLDLLGAGVAAAGLNWLVCVYLLCRKAVAGGPRRWLGLAGGLAALLLGAWCGEPLGRFGAANFYASRLGVTRELRERAALEDDAPALAQAVSRIAEIGPRIRRLRTRYQVADIIDDPRAPTELQVHYNRRLGEDARFPHGLTLYLDRRYQFWGASEAIYHEHMAHVPVQVFNRIPRDILVLGGGDGLLARELLKYGPRVASITNVELDPKIVELARGDPAWKRLNESAFDDPKVRVRTEDAFFFARNCRETFDAVYIDFPYPTNYTLTKLFSVEFFKNVARLLRPGGFIVIDYPLAERRPDSDLESDDEAFEGNRILASTLKAAGFGTLFPWSTTSPEPADADEAEFMSLGQADEDPKIEGLQDLIGVLRFRRDYPSYPVRGRPEDLVVVNNSAAYESFMAASREDLALDFRFKDHGIPLHHLNAARLSVLQDLDLPYVEDPEWVNSIFTPSLFDPHHLRDFAFE